ncbi:hypothetical protein [Deinococcus marmoris]|uniref:hypothetical protein n=1 Tax=Deinococcus marmoris TaxID=249408 RepID=UPI000497E176|nr:hypothetical protein [Deinococcus marmoris]
MELLQDVQTALQTLAQHCDGAVTRDHAGFNSPDALIGHRLARRPVEDWSLAEILCSAALCRRYRRQLETYGIDVSHIPLPSSEQVQEVRAAAQADKKTEKELARHRKKGYGLSRYGGTLVLQLPRDRHGVARAVSGHRWTAHGHGFPLTSLAALETVCTQLNLPVELTAADRLHIEQVLFPPQVRLEGGRIVFRFPPDKPKNDIVKGLGAKFVWNGRIWYMPAGQVAAAIEAARQAGLRLSPELRHLAGGTPPRPT